MIYLDIEIVSGESLEVFDITNDIKLTHSDSLNVAVLELISFDSYNYTFNFIAKSSENYRKFKIYTPNILSTQTSDKLIFLNSDNFNNLSLINNIENYPEE